MQICPPDKCTGCYACVNACHFKCISMQENEYGELHPAIDEAHCTHCNLCKKSCPNNIDLDFKYPSLCYASWITDAQKRKICASGGMGTILSEFVIKQKKGVVFGSRYDEQFTPIITCTEQLEELEYFKGSRYVQSIVGNDTLLKVKDFLKSGRFVLFIGTPCQIAGLKSFLRKDYDNLITVDLICHGVCPTTYFKEEVAYISKKKRIKNLVDVRFRGNDRKNFCLSFWTGKRTGNSRCIYNKSAYTQYYFAGFLLGVSLRENCYQCNYARPERISDITIGDFIGLGKEIPFNYSKRNVSSVTLNTPKGVDFYQEVSQHTDILINVQREYAERLKYKPSLIEPSHKHELNPLFREQVLKVGYFKAIRLTLNEIIARQKVKNIMNYWRYIYRIPRKAIQVIAQNKL